MDMKKTVLFILFLANTCYSSNLVSLFKLNDNADTNAVIDSQNLSADAKASWDNTAIDSNVHKQFRLTAINYGTAANAITAKILVGTPSAIIVTSGNIITIKRSPTTGTAAAIKAIWDTNAPALALASMALISDGALIPTATNFSNFTGGTSFPHFHGTNINTSDHNAMGQIDGALSFGGSTPVDKIDTDSNYTQGINFSVAGWFRSDDGRPPFAYSLIRHLNAHPDPSQLAKGMSVRINTQGTITASIRYNGQVSAATTPVILNDGQEVWHHFVAVYVISGGGWTVSIYFDGILKVTGTPITVSASFNSNIFIGGDEAGDEGDVYKGSLDDFRIYNTNLSPVKIRRLYRQGRGGVSLDWLPVRDTKLIMVK
jgi:hypothetical protein